MATGITHNKWAEDTHIISTEDFSGSFNYEISYEGKTNAIDLLTEKPKYSYKTLHSSEFDNQIIYGDNLDVLKSLLHEKDLKEKVKLVYIGPPYGTNSVFQSRNQKSSYKDDLVGSHYLEFMRRRLILLRELLCKDGSIYVHLDGNMAFQIKVIMDEVFGSKNFRGFITRKKCSNKNSTRKTYGNISDYILFYSKTDKYTWIRATESWSADKMLKEYPCIDEKTGKRYKKVPIHAPGTRNGETGKKWKGMMPPPGKHWQYTPSKLTELDNKGEIYWSANGNPRRKVFFDSDKGIPVQDIWLDVQDSLNQNIKITGYPTEKNPYLLERIIKASSNEGDIVLDCFNGSGTTIDLADQLKRKFIGIDNSSEAIYNTLKRFVRGVDEMGDYVNKDKQRQIKKGQQTLFEPKSIYSSNLSDRRNFNIITNSDHDSEITEMLNEFGLMKTDKAKLKEPQKEYLKNLRKDNVLGKLIKEFGEIILTPKSAEFGFKYLVDSIIGQQLSVTASNSIIKKLETSFGDNYEPELLLKNSLSNLKNLGVSQRKGSYIHALCEAVISAQIDFHELKSLSNEDVIKKLTCVKGIGVWTAKMYLIFILARENVFPTEDSAFSDQIRKLYSVNGDESLEKKMEELQKAWTPHESIGALYMWKKRDQKTVSNKTYKQ